jgi:cyclopropane fatty-acyl-phospholipid synthase-like methyltransferase
MKDMYETDQYEKNNPSWHEEDAPWKSNHVARMIKRNGLELGNICEIGCGTGEILLGLERQFPDVALSGYEIAPQAFNRAAEKATERTTFYLDDMLQRPELHFDLILAADVIEHVEDYLGFLTRLKPMAEYKIFHIPLDLSAQSVARSRPIMDLRRGVGHIHYFYKQSALAALEDCGYEVLDWFYTASRLELPNQALSSRLMKVPRRAVFKVNPDLAVRVLGGFSLMVLTK